MADPDVRCGKCQTRLNEPFNLALEKRTPCPKCGSTTRAYPVSLEARSTAQVRATATVAPARPNLLLQTVIVAGARTAEGKLIEAVAVPWFDIVALLQRDPSIAYQISPEKWEEIVAGAYKNAGFDEVTLTPRSGDYGRDVIAVKKALGVVRVIDQVKAFHPDHLVDANDVRALMGVLQTDGASKGFLTTTSDFAPRIRTDPLIVPFMPSRLELVDGKTLLAKLDELARRRK